MKTTTTIILALICSLGSLLSQEQLSFIEGGNQGSFYSILELYQFNNEARIVSVEKDGEVVITRLEWRRLVKSFAKF